MSAPYILVIEDDVMQYELYEDALARYDLRRFEAASDALNSIPERRPDLIILDHILARGELGLDYLSELKELLPHVPVIIVSGALEVHQLMGARQGPRRAHYCITKPVDLNLLARTVETALLQCGEAEIVRQFEALERAKRLDAEGLLSRSTDRLSRQTQIRQSLAASTERPNISSLARQYKVARRTIIRDLQELIRRNELPPDLYPPKSTDDDSDPDASDDGD